MVEHAAEEFVVALHGNALIGIYAVNNL